MLFWHLLSVGLLSDLFIAGDLIGQTRFTGWSFVASFSFTSFVSTGPTGLFRVAVLVWTASTHSLCLGCFLPAAQ